MTDNDQAVDLARTARSSRRRPRSTRPAVSCARPWAASVAGLLFASLFTAPRAAPARGDLHRGRRRARRAVRARRRPAGMVVGGLYLAPFAGIMFLWFVAVIRDQIGEREDRFFATVFFGTGILFVALLFVVAAMASAPSVGCATWISRHRPPPRSTCCARWPTRSRSRSRTGRPACSCSPPRRSASRPACSRAGSRSSATLLGAVLLFAVTLHGGRDPGPARVGCGRQPDHPPPGASAPPTRGVTSGPPP